MDDMGAQVEEFGYPGHGAGQINGKPSFGEHTTLAADNTDSKAFDERTDRAVQGAA
jgi:hypothetical protein